MWATTVLATDGDSIVSPAATVLIASTRSAGEVSFTRNPSAPAARASSTWSSVSNVVSTMMCGACGCSAIRRVASIPLMRGMRTSISTTSGSNVRTAVSASSPSLASPTTVRSDRPPSINPSAERTRASSSTISTLIAGVGHV